MDIHSSNIHTFMSSIGYGCVIINFSIIHVIKTALLKSDVSAPSKPTPPIVFNLQASDMVHCEEETGAHTGKYSAKIINY